MKAATNFRLLHHHREATFSPAVPQLSALATNQYTADYTNMPPFALFMWYREYAYNNVTQSEVVSSDGAALAGTSARFDGMVYRDTVDPRRYIAWLEAAGPLSIDNTGVPIALWFQTQEAHIMDWATLLTLQNMGDWTFQYPRDQLGMCVKPVCP